MRKFFFALVAAFVTSAATVSAQSPFPQPPFEQPGSPGSQVKCTSEYVTYLRTQEKIIAQLRDTAPAQIRTVCTAMDFIEDGARRAAKLLGRPEDEFIGLFEKQIEDLGRPLGIPKINARFLKHACSQAEGETSRLFVTQLGYIKKEIERCAGV